MCFRNECHSKIDTHVESMPTNSFIINVNRSIKQMMNGTEYFLGWFVLFGIDGIVELQAILTEICSLFGIALLASDREHSSLIFRVNIRVDKKPIKWEREGKAACVCVCLCLTISK